MKRRSLVVIVIMHSLLVTMASQVSPAQTPQRDDVVTITTNLVQIDAAVTDKKGKPVSDLGTQDFEVYEDGRPQKIRKKIASQRNG